MFKFTLEEHDIYCQLTSLSIFGKYLCSVLRSFSIISFIINRVFAIKTFCQNLADRVRSAKKKNIKE